MQRVLSFPPQSSRRFGDPSEFVTKRMCFSFMFSIAFLAILAGFLLGRFVFDQELELSRTKLRKHQQQQVPPRILYNESTFLREISEPALENHLRSLESGGDSLRSYHEARLIRAALEDGGFDLVSPMIESHINLSFPDAERDNLAILVGDGVRLTCNDSRPRISAQGHRTTATVRGNVVYVNFGRDEDYHQLDSLGVTVKDAVVIARVGRSPPPQLVANALEHEAVGVLLYKDPQQKDVEDPFLSPADLARINNPTYKSSSEDAVPLVCITSEDAEKIFNHMGTRDASPESWRGDLNSTYPIGPGLGHDGHLLIIVNTLTVSRKFYDVSGAIRGTHEPDRFVMVAHERKPGNDSDSTAIVIELVRAMGVLKKTKDWRPHRSIVVASWGTDTPSHSRTKDWWSRLRTTAVAYLKIESSLLGNASLPARGTPILEKVFRESASVASFASEPSLDVMLQASGPDVQLIENGVPFLRLKDPPNATRRLADVTSLWASLTWRLAQSGRLPFALDSYARFFNHSVDVIRERYKMMSHRRSLFLDSFFEAAQRLVQTIQSFQSRQSRDVAVPPIETRIANDQLLRFANVLSCRKEKQEYEHSFRHVIFSRSTLGPDQSAGFGLLRDLLRETTSTHARDDLQQQIITHLADLVECIDAARLALTDGLENVTRSE